ncbi:MAG: cupin domain-containing protein [Candidatus Binataceae bacterium]
MQVAHGAAMTFGPVSGHRSGGIDFKRLIQGAPGAPDNFELSLVRIAADYYTPRHRHNFDQVRLCLEGVMNFAPGRNLEPGSVGYFPEGTFYGPQQDTTMSIALVLQMGGAAGYGFMSYDQLNAGYQRLCDYGNFDHGVFTRTTSDGRTVRKDSYEAVWEHVMRREVEYPQPRFENPVVMFPRNFNWVNAGDGFEVKRLGGFGERGLELSFIRGARGAKHTVRGAATAPELLFLTSGAMRASNSSEALEAHTAWRLDSADVGATFEVMQDAEIFMIRLPVFSSNATA